MNDNKQRSLARPWSSRSNGYPWSDEDFLIVDMPRLRLCFKALCSAYEKVGEKVNISQFLSSLHLAKYNEMFRVVNRGVWVLE